MELAVSEETEGGSEIIRTRSLSTYSFSGESAFETTEAETSWSPKILRMSSKQFVSSKSCPRW